MKKNIDSVHQIPVIFLSLGLNVFVPTSFLRSRVTLPKDYEVTDVDTDVLISQMRLIDECERLKKEQCLSMMRVGSRWVLEIGITQPIVGADYIINWRPPTEEAYRKLLPKNLVKDRKSRIRVSK